MAIDLSKFDLWDPTPVAASSAQLKKRNTGASRSIPAPQIKTNPIPTNPVPQSSGGGSGGSSNYQYGGWYNGRQWDGSRFGAPGETIVGNGGGGPINNPTATAPQINWDEVFAPAFSAIDKQEDFLRNTELPSTYEDIEKERTKLQGELTENEQEIKTQTEKDQGRLYDSRKSALAEARNAYNSLNQRVISRFGGGSSAGGAAGEISRKEYWKQQGSVEKLYGERLSDLLEKQTQVLTFVSKRRAEIDDHAGDLRKEAKKEMVRRLNELQSQRGLLESEKRSQRTAILQDTISWTRQINAMKISAQLQLDSWRQMQSESIKNTYGQLNAQVVDVAQNQFNPLISSNINISPQQQQSTPPSYAWNPNYSEEDDPFTNPFYAE